GDGRAVPRRGKTRHRAPQRRPARGKGRRVRRRELRSARILSPAGRLHHVHARQRPVLCRVPSCNRADHRPVFNLTARTRIHKTRRPNALHAQASSLRFSDWKAHMQDDFDSGMDIPDDELTGGSGETGTRDSAAHGAEMEGAEGGSGTGRRSGGARARKSSGGGGGRKAAGAAKSAKGRKAGRKGGGAMRKAGAKKAARKAGGAKKAARKGGAKKKAGKKK